jgi:hypothetical protein
MNNNLNKHTIITRDLCIYIQQSTLELNTIKNEFISRLTDEGDFYAHIFNGKGFPILINTVNLKSSDECVVSMCGGICCGFLSAVEDVFNDTYLDDNFFVFISKDYNDKLELVVI